MECVCGWLAIIQHIARVTLGMRIAFVESEREILSWHIMAALGFFWFHHTTTGVADVIVPLAYISSVGDV